MKSTAAPTLNIAGIPRLLRYLEIKSSAFGAPRQIKTISGSSDAISPAVSLLNAVFSVKPNFGERVPTNSKPGLDSFRRSAANAATPSAPPTMQHFRWFSDAKLQIRGIKSEPASFSDTFIPSLSISFIRGVESMSIREKLLAASLNSSSLCSLVRMSRFSDIIVKDCPCLFAASIPSHNSWKEMLWK